MSKETNKTNSFDIFKLFSFIAAFIALVGFTFFIKFLITNVSTPDPQWIRLMDLFGSVEAIVFAASGFLFGREVNRQRANNAEHEAKTKEKEAEKAKQNEEEAKDRVYKREADLIKLEGAMEKEKEKSKLFIRSILSAISNDYEHSEKISSFLNANRFDDSKNNKSGITDLDLDKISRDKNIINNIVQNFYPELKDDTIKLVTEEAVNFSYSFTGKGFKSIIFNDKRGNGESGTMKNVSLGHDGKVEIRVEAQNHSKWEVKFSEITKVGGGSMRAKFNPTEGEGNSDAIVYFNEL